jgi:polygalacturonase
MAQKKTPKELYVPMDYSVCGYRASEARIPDVPVAAYVAWHEGDCSQRLQQAIDYVSGLKPDAEGHRGTVLIGEGTFHLDRPLVLHTSGVVLRGTDKNKTILVKYGPERGAEIWGQGAWGKGQEK